MEMKPMNKLGFIGAGNMGGAIIDGIIKVKSFESKDIFVCDKVISEKISTLNVTVRDLVGTVSEADTIILAVKPAGLVDILKEVTKVPGFDKKTYISIAAGFKICNMEKILGDVKIIRVMPNICLKVGEGMTVMCKNDNCSKADMDTAIRIFGSCGRTAVTKEELIDSCTAINGSGPAYVFMFMEAMADAAVKHGIDRETAYLLSAQTLLGSAKLMMDTGEHPGKLKDIVCSPGGTTIEAVSILEEKGLRDAVISAVDACAAKAKKLSD